MLGHKVTSLLVGLVLAGALICGAAVWMYLTHGDNADILGLAIGVAALYGAALLDGALKLNLMSSVPFSSAG